MRCSGLEHMKLDVQGIHQRVCSLMALMEREGDPIPFNTAMGADQIRREHRNHYLVNQFNFVSANG